MKDLSVFYESKSPLQKLDIHFLKKKRIALYLKRDDLLHPVISGNKWRKLKYNLVELQKSGQEGIVTFGGAFSNHLHAVAAAGKEFDFKTVGIVRGEKPQFLSATLQFCIEMGMKLYFVSRSAYRMKETCEDVLEILRLYPSCVVLPEGGANQLAMKGCAEIVSEIEVPFDFLCVACGTGTTLAGLAQNSDIKKALLGFSVLKGIGGELEEKTGCKVVPDYHFGGYAKYSDELLDFIRNFENETKVPLEQVYTGKMMYGLFEMLQNGFFEEGTSIIALHTGGLQGRLPII
jgi:1-aminocyclopropane-1-carboxylate deaminase